MDENGRRKMFMLSFGGGEPSLLLQGKQRLEARNDSVLRSAIGYVDPRTIYEPPSCVCEA